MKKLFSISIVLLFISCQKEYVCVCTSSCSKQDTIIDHIKTTKLGSKGYKKTCINQESKERSDCHIQ